MLIDTDDAVTLSHLNPLERQMLRSLADRLSMTAWQRVGWMGRPAPLPNSKAEPSLNGDDTPA